MHIRATANTSMRKVGDLRRIQDEEEMEMTEFRGTSAPINIPPPPSQLQIGTREKYERNLRGIKKIAFVTDLTAICNWFFGFCALTWASAVLLGAYIQQLSMWDYYDVSLLLFVEGLRFGLAASLRLLGYRLSDLIRWSLRSVACYQLPLGMGGFAVLSILPVDIRRSIRRRITGHSDSLPHDWHGSMLHVITTISRTVDPAPPPSDFGYRSLSPSLHIFYTLILLNAFFLLLGSTVTGLMRRRYVRSNVKSLCIYHDKMLDSTTSWLHSTVDLNFAFEIQGSEYRRGKEARYVCEHYTDLIWYLYMQDKGLEAAEAALVAEDGCVRKAAANIMGFWAVLEKLEELQLRPKLPLCFQRGMLSKLGDIAAESYGALGTAAARAFSLLLESVDLEWIGMVACIHSRSTGKDLIDILLGRTVELLHPPCPGTYNLPRILQEESHAHVYALREYLRRLQSPCEGSDVAVTAFIEVQRARLVQKVREALPQMVRESDVSTIESLDNQLCSLLRSIEPADHKNYFYDIQSKLRGLSPRPPTWARPIKASLLLFVHVALPLVCLGVGFIVNALM